MNGDLISREAAIEQIERRIKYLVGDKGVSPEAFIRFLRNRPTVDAEPVRHGWWIHCKGKSNLWYCSECGEKIIYNPTRKTYMPNKKPVHEVNKRCRNCGAKMDGEGNG